MDIVNDCDGRGVEGVNTVAVDECSRKDVALVDVDDLKPNPERKQ